MVAPRVVGSQESHPIFSEEKSSEYRCLTSGVDAIKNMDQIKALECLSGDFSDLGEWLKPLCRYTKLEDFITGDYKENRLLLTLFTKDHQYSISAHLPIEGDAGYLGCVACTRKPRAGEDWNRGSDLADGSYSKETLERIAYDIIAYELVKVVKTQNYVKDSN